MTDTATPCQHRVGLLVDDHYRCEFCGAEYVPPMYAETEVLQFGRRCGWVCSCGVKSKDRYDAWREAEDAAGAHEDAHREAAVDRKAILTATPGDSMPAWSIPVERESGSRLPGSNRGPIHYE